MTKFLDAYTVYPKKYAHGFCFAVLCCGYTLTDFLISTRLTSLALWQSNDCPSASKATLMNMDKYFMWIHYERLHNHNKAKHNKTVCIFLGIYCMRRLTATMYKGKLCICRCQRKNGFGYFQISIISVPGYICVWFQEYLSRERLINHCKFQPKTLEIYITFHGVAFNCKAITWTNADPVHWRIYATLEGDELMLITIVMSR